MISDTVWLRESDVYYEKWVLKFLLLNKMIYLTICEICCHNYCHSNSFHFWNLSKLWCLLYTDRMIEFVYMIIYISVYMYKSYGICLLDGKDAWISQNEKLFFHSFGTFYYIQCNSRVMPWIKSIKSIKRLVTFTHIIQNMCLRK